MYFQELCIEFDALSIIIPFFFKQMTLETDLFWRNAACKCIVLRRAIIARACRPNHLTLAHRTVSPLLICELLILHWIVIVFLLPLILSTLPPLRRSPHSRLLMQLVAGYPQVDPAVCATC
jgi:hypothetical protein